MKARLVPGLAMIALALAVSACHRPDTRYNNSGASATPGSSTPATAPSTATTTDTTTAPTASTSSDTAAPTASTTPPMSTADAARRFVDFAVHRVVHTARGHGHVQYDEVIRCRTIAITTIRRCPRLPGSPRRS